MTLEQQLNDGGALVKTTFLQDTEAVPILKLSGIPIKRASLQGHEGSLSRKTDRVRVGEEKEKNRQQKGTETEGRAKPHQKGKKDIQSLKTVL